MFQLSTQNALFTKLANGEYICQKMTVNFWFVFHMQAISIDENMLFVLNANEYLMTEYNFIMRRIILSFQPNIW